MALQQISNATEFTELIKSNKLIVVHFMAEWAPQCENMNEVLIELSKQDELKNITYSKIMAEEVPEVSEKFKIIAVPTLIIFLGGKVVERVDGANAAELTTKVKRQAAKSSLLTMGVNTPNVDITERLKKIISSSKCMLFMKGIPDAPRCGFSKTTVELLNKYNADFGSFDILSDEEVRQGLKTYSNWPTYPQLYINNELVGGLDILKEMDESGDLEALLPKKIKIEDRLIALINKSPIMVFMKGQPSQPRCGFSRQLMEILTETKLPFDSFDILTDEEIRQGLKTYSDWPTYPQVYVKGEFVGGLDIIKELKSDGSLLTTLNGE